MGVIKHNSLPVDHLNTIFMGIDQSLTHTGLCFLEKHSSCIEVVHSEGISTIASDFIENRLFHIVTRVRELILKFKPGCICIEGLAYQVKGTNNGSQLGGLFFSLLILFVELKIPYRVVNIKTLKKASTGNGAASKIEMEDFIEDSVADKLSSLCGKKRGSKLFEDIVDSYWLANYGCDLGL